MSRALEVIVLGAGVVGMATALTLSDRGHRVTIIDRATGPGRGTSFANGAQLSYAYTDALASPSTLSQMPWLLLGVNPAFRLRPSLDFDFLRWSLAFVRNTSASRFRHNTKIGLELALESRAALHDIATKYGIEFAHSTPGKLHLYRSTKSLDGARSMMEFKSGLGVRQRLINTDEMVAIEPTLANVQGHIAGALYTPDEEVGDPHRFCVGAHAALSADGNNCAMFDVGVERIDADRRRPSLTTECGKRLSADLVVLSAGVQSMALARSMGVALPIIPMKGYSITTAPGPAAPSVSVTDVTNRVVFARLGDRMRIAGLADLGNRTTTIEPHRLNALIRSARAALPHAANYETIDSSWVGLRPMTPNSLPITRWVAPGIIANTGHGALGWTYAAGSARRVADIIEGRD